MTEGRHKLTEADARRALIELAEHPGGRESVLYERLDDLKAGGALDFVPEEEANIFHGERWTVCLPREEFKFLATRGRHSWILAGRFEYKAGRWVATVMEQMRQFHPERPSETKSP